MPDYKNTIFLPKTSFSMKANLKEREPQILKFWQEKNIYQQVQIKHANREKFILHVGPPYANGHIHVGHAFNYILKDIVIRTQQLCGKATPMVPGWDCHGLPIEWKIEETYRKKGKSKDQVPMTDFRQQCRLFAEEWVGIQREEFKRLGLLWDWDQAYITMDFEAEADTVETFLKFLDKGSLYKGIKPVLWSVVEKTALAEAEVEYENKTSTYVYVRFPLKTSLDHKINALKNLKVSVIIWTTTPWTLPGNRAVSFGPDITYGLYQLKNTESLETLYDNEVFLVACDLIKSFAKEAGFKDYTLLGQIQGHELASVMLEHPLKDLGYTFDVPLIAGDHVTTEAGTGLVHTAPGHGLEDFEVCKLNNIEVPETVGEDGIYYPHVPVFKGQHIFKADESLLATLIETKTLVKAGQLLHSYPHSWRSKAPLIYRTTAQWFISMDKTNLREVALKEIDHVQWIPAQGKNRIRGMVESRPDWCISRQRAWGVPLTLFIDKHTGQPLHDPKVNKRIIEAVRQEGADAWFNSPPERFLGSSYSADSFEQVKDILDVWFDSGSTQHFVLDKYKDLKRPASLYLEGSDQHRGWFQSSLLVGCGTAGNAPYQAVLTHGFVLDEQGRKMSKSLGNVIAPEKIIETLGAEILRLWVVACDFKDDLRIGSTILKHQEDIYRRYRNTLRYLLGGLADFTSSEKVSISEMPDLEKWILHRLYELQQAFVKSSETYEMHSYYAQLHTFCAIDLSAFYFDIRKDILYCDDPQGVQRRSVRTVMDHIFNALVHWLSPVLCFTTEEAWQARFSQEQTSLQLSDMPEFPTHWMNPELAQKIEKQRQQRRFLTGALEQARIQGLIGSSLQAEVLLYDPEQQLTDIENLTELSIVSKLTLLKEAIPSYAYHLNEFPDLGIVIQLAPGHKCERCWRVCEEVKPEELLCHRCHKVVNSLSFNDSSTTACVL